MKLAFLLLLVAHAAFGQASVVGQWKTVDDSSGEVKAIVELFQSKGTVSGKIVRIFDKEHPDPTCEACDEDDDRYRKKIVGMEIIRGLVPDGEGYGSGEILDPENGRVYRCKVWIEEGNLIVRGYWGPFYRTQIWRKSS
ncbi:DUF2147 domain-containing protein [Chryseolinea sp. T2]|uniref:DUF2147 domain-containing protein n=1 Tax=Chryseolinea sp. T2 TaxID=3129255 RepID=UPI003076F08F